MQAAHGMIFLFKGLGGKAGITGAVPWHRVLGLHGSRLVMHVLQKNPRGCKEVKGTTTIHV